MTVTIHVGDCIEVLRTLPAESVHCVCTSPPYFALRSYLPDGHPDKAKEIGLQETPEQYVAKLVRVFRQVRRVLHPTGTVWLNLGDSYGRGERVNNPSDAKRGLTGNTGQVSTVQAGGYGHGAIMQNKQLMMIPARVALALQADGWWIRSDIIWAKGISFCDSYSGSSMPESVRDRPSTSHEHVFLLAKNERYFYDIDAVREAYEESSLARYQYGFGGDGYQSPTKNPSVRAGNISPNPQGRNLRNVWTINPQPFPDSHFAVFPPALVEPMIKAGCPEDGTVLDPFAGAGTALMVADRLGRNAIGIELNPDYADMAARRIYQDAGMFADVKVTR